MTLYKFKTESYQQKSNFYLQPKLTRPVSINNQLSFRHQKKKMHSFVFKWDCFGLIWGWATVYEFLLIEQKPL